VRQASASGNGAQTDRSATVFDEFCARGCQQSLAHIGAGSRSHADILTAMIDSVKQL
jgi:hypothetical protein